MSLPGMMLRTGLRHRWKSWLALSLLIALAVGLVLAGAQTARRTATAFPQYESAHGYDLFAYAVNPISNVAALPGVAASVHLEIPGSGVPRCSTCTSQINENDFAVQETTPEQLARVVKLVSGQLPDQSDPEQVIASANLASLGVHVGTVFHVPLVSSAQRASLYSNATITPAGPTVTLRVVGMEIAEFEFPTNSIPSYDLFATDAFARKYNAGTVLFNAYLVRLHGGARSLPRFESAAKAAGIVGSTDLDGSASSISSSLEPQAVGWWILTALIALVGLLVLAQALARQTAIDGEDHPVLRAVGATERQLFVCSIARTVVLGFVGVCGAVALAAGLSSFTPVGEARLADPDPGFAFDPLLLLGGAAVALAVVVVIGFWPAVKASRPASTDEHPASRPSRVVEAVSASGAPPTMLIGVRNALERGRGRNAVPVGSAMVGSILAVAALCGAVVFSSSLTSLTTTPTQYGQGFDAWFSSNGTGTPAQSEQLLAALERPGITAVLAGIAGAVTINGREVPALAGQSVRGPYLMTVSSGAQPTVTDQVLLGPKTMSELGVHIGSRVHVNFPSADAAPGQDHFFTVVGTTELPADFNSGALGTGAVFTLAGFLGHGCPAGTGRPACLASSVMNGSGAFLVRRAPGPTGEAALAALGHAYPSQVNIPQPPTNLVNFGEAVNFPLILGLIVALFGIATLLHLLLMSLNRRRRETGLLKSLGMVRRQIISCVSWQTTTIAVIAIVVGIPLGIAAGRLVWSAFANNVGVGTLPVVTVAAVVAVALGTLVVANVLAVVPALLAARERPASLFRSE